MVRMLASSVVDRGFVPWSGQTKDYKIGICCLSALYILQCIYNAVIRTEDKRPLLMPTIYLTMYL
jgi:hypothetical protein